MRSKAGFRIRIKKLRKSEDNELSFREIERLLSNQGYNIKDEDLGNLEHPRRGKVIASYYMSILTGPQKGREYAYERDKKRVEDFDRFIESFTGNDRTYMEEYRRLAEDTAKDVIREVEHRDKNIAGAYNRRTNEIKRIRKKGRFKKALTKILVGTGVSEGLTYLVMDCFLPSVGIHLDPQTKVTLYATVGGVTTASLGYFEERKIDRIHKKYELNINEIKEQYEKMRRQKLEDLILHLGASLYQTHSEKFIYVPKTIDAGALLEEAKKI